jgi:hypothetical protein
MKDRQDLEAWADGFLDEHRTAPRPDPQRERERGARALRELPPVTRRMLTRGGREPDVWSIAPHPAQLEAPRDVLQVAILTLIGAALLCAFGLVYYGPSNQGQPPHTDN